MYLKYKDLRPTVDPQSKFYLQENRYWQISGSWLNNAPIGKYSLCSIAKTLIESVGFKGKHTNHSARKTFFSNLLDKGVPPTEVAQISGRKNIQPLNRYHNLERQRQLSVVIHTPSKSSHSAPAIAVTDEFAEVEINDNELAQASREFEIPLQNIESFEEVGNASHADNLPVV